MSKKKGLGRDIEKSMEVMDNLLGCLDEFHHMRLQNGLRSTNIDEGDLDKKIEKALIDSSALKVLVDSIQRQISGAKPKGNARFASQRVISKFLSIED
jgi:hypothetical protein